MMGMRQTMSGLFWSILVYFGLSLVYFGLSLVYFGLSLVCVLTQMRLRDGLLGRRPLHRGGRNTGRHEVVVVCHNNG